MVYAPVVVPTLCRFEHFKKLVESLQKNEWAKYTDLYIAVDYPAKPAHEDGHRKICEYLDAGIEGFNEVIIEKRTENYGAAKNSADITKKIRDKYDRWIYMEDDIEVAPSFLEFMDKALEKYKDDPRVLRICGFSYPLISKPPSNYSELTLINAWGAGFWADKVIWGKAPLAYFRKKFRNYIHARRCIENNALSYEYMLDCILYAKPPLCGDLKNSAYATINHMYAIAPVTSLVRNNGFDGSGLHCDSTQCEQFDAISMDESAHFDFRGELHRLTKEDIRAINAMFYPDTKKRLLKLKCKAIIFMLFGVSGMRCISKIKKGLKVEK